ncbi:MAG TPA: hypothetical protein VLV88_13985 [Terriglobales bacterium]|nr:hypothetical protein [Terriglobales bacterium]
MRKTTVFAVVRVAFFGVGALVACAELARADEIEAPKPKIETKEEPRKEPGPLHRKLFWAETGVLAASAGFDWTTTAQCQQRGCQEAASSWAIGHFPSNARIAAYGSAWFAGDAAALYFAEKSRHRWFKWIGRAYVAYETQDHFRLAFANRGLCRGAGSCDGKL